MSDPNFVPIKVTVGSGEYKGKEITAYFYKPQQIIVTGYMTLEFFDKLGWKYEEVKNE